MDTKLGVRVLLGVAGFASISLLASFPIFAQYSYTYSVWSRPAYIPYEQQDDTELSVLQMLEQDNQFETLASELERTGLANTLKQEGSITIFAPTDEAFDALPYETAQKLMQPENLKKVLQYHLVAQSIQPEEIPGRVNTITGAPVTISMGKNNSQEFWINEEAKVMPRQFIVDGKEVTSLLFADNGTIVPISQVLLPPDF